MMNREQVMEAHSLADRYTAHFLLNCYCREIAGPNCLTSLLGQDGRDSGWNFSWGVDHPLGRVLAVDLPYVATRLLVMVDKLSVTHNYRFISDLLSGDAAPTHASTGNHFDQRSRNYKPFAWADVPELIVAELCRRFGLVGQPELLAQIRNSRDLLAMIIDHHLSRGQAPDLSVNDFLISEQSMFFGHSFHPSPKSRQGLDVEELVHYSPEFNSAFQLHYFAVSPDCVRIFSGEAVDLSDLFQQAGHVSHEVCPADWLKIPCHPWQARFLLALPPVKKAARDGKLVYLGARGSKFSPTASVRTLYNKDFPYFVKASLSLRITNSVRKNAYYELESAVAMSRLLDPVAGNLRRRFKGFSLLSEPMAVTVDLPELNDRERLDIQSHFGLILRKNEVNLPGTRKAILAGTLFGDDIRGRSNVTGVIRRFRQARSCVSRAEASVLWFRQYVRELLPPVLEAFFEHGVAFEPHLQNTLLVIDDHAVVGIILRDMEGTKLDASRWLRERLPSISERARASICHEQAVAWRRVVYCLFVNNLCQAVYHCNHGAVSEAALWEVVGKELESYMMCNASALCLRLVGAILNGDSLPGKANLLTRFKQQADGDAYYVDVPNPLRLTAVPGHATEHRAEVISP